MPLRGLFSSPQMRLHPEDAPVEQFQQSAAGEEMARVERIIRMAISHIFRISFLLGCKRIGGFQDSVKVRETPWSPVSLQIREAH